MSDKNPVEARAAMKKSRRETALDLIQVVAGLVIVLGVGTMINRSDGWGLPVAFIAFVVFLVARGLRRR